VTHVYILATAIQALLAIGQILLKLLAIRMQAAGWSVLHDFHSLLGILALTVACGALYACVAALWIYVLQSLPVSRAFLFVSLTFIFVPLFAFQFLGEPITIGTIVGGMLIIFGIAAGVLM
jgi:drug/metabolite transporter (DMT)-like permease